ncbi:MAG: patatin-like phospholipase family protein [Clostridia bacterium]
MKIGLALAGGGVKGAGHIGVIKALQENGIEVGYIAGTSIGSIVSALYAMGYNTDEMLKLFKYFAKDIMKVDPKYFWTNVKTGKRLLGDGLISGENIELAIEECARLKEIKTLKDINIPIAMPTVDIKTNKKYVATNHKYDEIFTQEKYINEISIGKAVRASSSYPGVFAPTIYKEHKFVDGGIIDNLPTDEVRKLGAEKVLSIRFSSENNNDPNNMIEVIMKSIDLMFDQRTAQEVANSDFAITLDLPEASVFNIRKIDYCYNQGYIAAMENMAKIKKIFS